MKNTFQPMESSRAKTSPNILACFAFSTKNQKKYTIYSVIFTKTTSASCTPLKAPIPKISQVIINQFPICEYFYFFGISKIVGHCHLTYAYFIVEILLINYVFSSRFSLIPRLTPTILALCLMFERLFLRYMNQLYIHLRTKNIFPVKIVLPWFQNLFVGVLSVESTFQLWDRVMGYNTTHVLVILALSIFKYYEKGLIDADDDEELEDVFMDLKEVNILEIINYFLFYSA